MRRSAILTAAGLALSLGLGAAAMADGSADEAAVKSAVTAAQQQFNEAQLLSPDPAVRAEHARTLVDDVTRASAAGPSSFVAGATEAGDASAFRVKMVAVFDESVVVDEARGLADQLLRDATDAGLPSMVRTSFTALGWESVRIGGDTARVTVIGRYTNCFAGGPFAATECVTSKDEPWRLRLRRGADGRWRLTERIGGSAD